MAQEYDAVPEPGDAVYQAGNRCYVQGVRTNVRRSGYDVYGIPVLKDIGGSAESSGCYTVAEGAPQQTAYHEFRMRYPWKKPFSSPHHVPASVDVSRGLRRAVGKPEVRGGSRLTFRFVLPRKSSLLYFAEKGRIVTIVCGAMCSGGC